MKKIITKYILNQLIQTVLFALLVLAPFASFSQPSSPGSTPATGGGTATGGTNPDPVGVPIDGIEFLLAAGLAFAVLVTVKQWKKKAIGN